MNVELSVCGQISYYKTTLERIKRNPLTNLELHGSRGSLPLNSSMDGRIRDEIDLSIRNRSRNMLQFSVHNNQVRNTMNGSRSNVMISESTERLSSGLPFGIQVRNTISGSRSNILASKDLNDVQVRNTLSGSRLNINKTYDYDREDNLELVLAQEGRKDNIVRSAKVLESDRIGLDLTASENTRETHHQAMSKQMDIEFTDEPGFVDPRDLARRRFQSGFQRAEPNPSRHENLIELNYLTVSVEIDGTQMRNPSGIDFSKSMTQMLESLKDNWSTTMKTLLTDQEERVGRLEQGFAAVSSSI